MSADHVSEREAPERDWRRERFEIPLADVRLWHDERRSLAQTHCRIDFEMHMEFDGTGELVEVDVPLVEPICANCREPWGKHGCSTVRAVLLVGIHEREAKKSARRVSELTEALTPRFGISKLRDPGNKSVELRMHIDQHTLIYGGLDIVDAALAKMHAHFRRWFTDVGDRARARSDKVWAATIDSERYVWLTRTFDPYAPVFKRPEAPWDAFVDPSGSPTEEDTRATGALGSRATTGGV